jgi:hypothetical protein
MPPPTGRTLSSEMSAPFAVSSGLLEQTGSTKAQVVLAVDAGKADLAVLAQRDADAVGPIEQTEHRLQLVVAGVVPLFRAGRARAGRD